MHICCLNKFVNCRSDIRSGSELKKPHEQEFCYFHFSPDQDELFDLILAGEFEYLSPFWDDISESAKVQHHSIF